MKSFLVLMTVVGTSALAVRTAAPIPADPPGLNAILAADLKRDLFAFAGDDMRGREGGTLDEMRASVWIADRAREAGMEPAGDDGTYFQFFPMARVTQSEGSRITIGSRSLTMGRDAIVTARTDVYLDAPLVFAGDGSASELAAADLKGKIVAVQAHTPPATSAPLPPARPGPSNGAENRIAPEGRRAQIAINTLRDSVRARGAVALIVVADSLIESQFSYLYNSASLGSFTRDTIALAPRAGVTTQTAFPILVIKSGLRNTVEVKDQRAVLNLFSDRFVYPSVNVVAKIPGSDRGLRGEYVMFSAHQDHDGVRYPVNGDSIWNGADDNATVAVALLAIGRAIKKSPTRRSSLFIWHGSEERGLHGSYYYSAHPTVPLDSIVAVLNGDMIGRNSPDTAALLGSQPPHRNSTPLVNMALAANAQITKFIIDSSWDRPTHPEGWYYRSDHEPYARLRVPAIFFSTLLHADYHTPKDEPDRIDINKLTKMTKWMYATGYAVGMADKRPTIDTGFKLERAGRP